MEFHDDVLKIAHQKIFFSRHALDQMNKPDRLITPKEVEEVIFSGKLIEDYVEDSRGHSCLLSGKTEQKRVLHVVCAPQKEYLLVITSYIPNPEEWDIMLEKRKRPNL